MGKMFQLNSGYIGDTSPGWSPAYALVAGGELSSRPPVCQMALHRLLQLSSVLRSAVSLTLRRNIGISAVLFNRAKELDPVQKLFLDKIRDYNAKSKLVAVSQPNGKL